MSSLSCSPEMAASWDELTDLCEIEQVPVELPIVGGFEYFVAPDGFLPPYAFGGYDDTEVDPNGTEHTYSTIIVSPQMASHVRGLLVGHMARHKFDTNVTDPHQCVNHDKCAQLEIVEREPSLLTDFYLETARMYGEGLIHKPKPRTGLERVERERYEKGYKNATSRGSLVTAAAEVRLQLTDQGLELPDGELALIGRVHKTGDRWFIKLETERGRNGHTCRNCSHGIKPGTERVTTVIEHRKKAEKYTHHHYHPGCFTQVEIAAYGDLHQVAAEEVPFH